MHLPRFTHACCSAGAAGAALEPEVSGRLRASLDGSRPWLHAPTQWLARSAPPAPRDGAAPGAAVCIQPRHLETALLSTRPSLPAAEYAHREAALRRFERRDERDADAAAQPTDAGRPRVIHA